MNEIIDMIVAQAAIWAPALVSVIGIVAAACSAIARVKNTVSESKKALNELKQEQTFVELNDNLRAAINENQELREQNSMLLDRITQIEGYVEDIKRQEANK